MKNSHSGLISMSGCPTTLFKRYSVGINGNLTWANKFLIYCFLLSNLCCTQFITVSNTYNT